MPRFFFHRRESNSIVRDEEGRDLPDRTAAHAVAVMSARSILCDELLTGRVSLNGEIEVQDERGGRVETLPFTKVVKIERDDPEPEPS